MFGLGPWEFLLIGITFVFVTMPMWLILKKAGLPVVLSLPAFLPFILLILLWYLAFAKWPNLRTKGEPREEL